MSFIIIEFTDRPGMRIYLKEKSDYFIKIRKDHEGLQILEGNGVLINEMGDSVRSITLEIEP